MGLGDVWFPVFNPFLAATVSNAAASAQLGGSGWRGPIISIRGKVCQAGHCQRVSFQLRKSR